MVTAPGRTTIVRQVPAGRLMKAQGVRVSRLPQAAHRLPTSSSPAQQTSEPAAIRASSETSSIPRSTGQVNLRRLSIPPSTILRPLMEHGPLPASPIKHTSDHGSPQPIPRGRKIRRDNTGGMLRSLFQGTARAPKCENSEQA